MVISLTPVLFGALPPAVGKSAEEPDAAQTKNPQDLPILSTPNVQRHLDDHLRLGEISRDQVQIGGALFEQLASRFPDVPLDRLAHDFGTWLHKRGSVKLRRLRPPAGAMDRLAQGRGLTFDDHVFVARALKAFDKTRQAAPDAKPFTPFASLSPSEGAYVFRVETQLRAAIRQAAEIRSKSPETILTRIQEVGKVAPEKRVAWGDLGGMELSQLAEVTAWYGAWRNEAVAPPDILAGSTVHIGGGMLNGAVVGKLIANLTGAVPLDAAKKHTLTFNVGGLVIRGSSKGHLERGSVIPGAKAKILPVLYDANIGYTFQWDAHEFRLKSGLLDLDGRDHSGLHFGGSRRGIAYVTMGGIFDTSIGLLAGGTFTFGKKTDGYGLDIWAAASPWGNPNLSYNPKDTEQGVFTAKRDINIHATPHLILGDRLKMTGMLHGKWHLGASDDWALVQALSVEGTPRGTLSSKKSGTQGTLWFGGSLVHAFLPNGQSHLAGHLDGRFHVLPQVALLAGASLAANDTLFVKSPIGAPGSLTTSTDGERMAPRLLLTDIVACEMMGGADYAPTAHFSMLLRGGVTCVSAQEQSVASDRSSRLIWRPQIYFGIEGKM